MRTRVAPGIWLAIYALLMPLTIGVVALWPRLRTLHDAASWAQAFGSIFAIAAGFGGILLQAHLARREAAQAEAARREKISEIVRLVVKVAEAIRATVEGNSFGKLLTLRAGKLDLERLLKGLDAVQVLSLNSAEAIAEFLAFCDAVRDLTARTDNLVNALDAGPVNETTKRLVASAAMSVFMQGRRYLFAADHAA